MKEPETFGPGSAALFRGVKVDVYTVDKTEISLTRQHLVELINVRGLLFVCLKNDEEFTYIGLLVM